MQDPGCYQSVTRVMRASRTTLLILLLMVTSAVVRTAVAQMCTVHSDDPIDLSSVTPLESFEPIPVVFHIVASDIGTGNVTTADLAAQVDTLNARFPIGFEFYLAGVTRTFDSELTDFPGPGLPTVESALEIDSERTINVFVGTRPEEREGWARLPSDNEAETGVSID